MNLIDFSGPDFYENPYLVYRELRAEGDLVNVSSNMWMSGRYDIVTSFLRDKRLGRGYIGQMRSRYGNEIASGEAFRLFEQSVLMMNKPRHTHIRSILMQAFNAAYLAELEKFVQTVANQLVDKIESDGSADLISQFSLPLPLIIICKMLGLDREDTEYFMDGMWRFTQSFSRTLEVADISISDIDKANESVRVLEAFFEHILADKRLKLGTDLISVLMQAGETNASLTKKEVIANIIFLFAAGHETTSNMIGNALITLFRNKTELDQLLHAPTLLPNYVNECLRFDSSVQMSSREALVDFQFNEHRICRGDTVFLCLGAANRDPTRYDDPDRFKIDRPGLGFNSMSSFGGGAHFCLGAQLATMEINIALATIFHRLPTLRLNNLDNLRWRSTNVLRGVESLSATWEL